MIGCLTARRLIDERIDGDIGPADAIDLELHLNGCPACGEVASGLDAVSSALRRLPLETMPDADVEAVLARTVGRGSSREAAPRASSRRRLHLAAAAVLAAAVLIPFTLRDEPPADPSLAEVEQAAAEARMVLALASRAMRAGETAARERVIRREISPALRHVPLRWSHVLSPRRTGS